MNVKVAVLIKKYDGTTIMDMFETNRNQPKNEILMDWLIQKNNMDRSDARKLVNNNVFQMVECYEIKR